MMKDLIILEIQIIGEEPYNKRKYRDDFGKKPNPFKWVKFVNVILEDRPPLALTLKFANKPNDDQIKNKVIWFLKHLELIKKQETDEEQEILEG